METKVNREQAEGEISTWLDYKKVGDSKRETYKDQIAELVEGVMDGTLVIGADKSITHTLKFQTEGETPVKELKYKPRLAVRDINKAVTGVKSGDQEGRMLGYVAAATNQAKGIIGALDSVDYSIASSIIIFFT